jgi:oxalate decarboxylase
VHHVRSATPGVSGRRRHRLAGGAGRRPTGQALLAKNFGLPEATFANFPKEEVYFARGKPPPAEPSAPLQGWKLPPDTHRYRLLAQPPHATYPGGREWRVDSSRFPIAKTITGVILDLDPGALRTLHWHPNADEWQYVIEGEVSVTLFGSHGRYRTERLEKGTSATSRRAMATRSRMSAAGRRAS